MEDHLRKNGFFKFLMESPPEKLDDWLSLYFEACMYESLVEDILRQLGWSPSKIQLFKEKTKEEAKKRFFDEKRTYEEMIEE